MNLVWDWNVIIKKEEQIEYQEKQYVQRIRHLYSADPGSNFDLVYDGTQLFNKHIYQRPV
jgi:hypothetical protein